MIDSIGDKGSALASTKVKGKLNQLNAKYHALCQSAQTQVKKAENEVDQHQKLQDMHQQCQDWMAVTKDKLAVCAEASGDRQALQNRLDKVQVRNLFQYLELWMIKTTLKINSVIKFVAKSCINGACKYSCL